MKAFFTQKCHVLSPLSVFWVGKSIQISVFSNVFLRF